MLSLIPQIRPADILDILLVAFIIYWILVFIRGTRAVQMVSGLLLVMGLFVLSKKIGMVTFQWIVGNFLGSLMVILVVIFQTEIRRGLAKVGQSSFFGPRVSIPTIDFLEVFGNGIFSLAATRTGAIVLFERENGLQEFVENGKAIDATYSNELLAAIFSTASPIHDGAVVVRNERIAAAAVILPIPGDTSDTRGMGTRHRASWGIASETDTIAVVVSEETGNVSIFHDRTATRVNSSVELRDTLRVLFGKKESAR
ncbi:MAG TPA: diadenylate cyclase CdaA [Candidatus Deferrimicrobiaceae bacterium]|jgi:diadenylate cyclase